MVHSGKETPDKGNKTGNKTEDGTGKGTGNRVGRGPGIEVGSGRELGSIEEGQ